MYWLHVAGVVVVVVVVLLFLLFCYLLVCWNYEEK